MSPGDSAQQRGARVLTALVNRGVENDLFAPYWQLHPSGRIEGQLFEGTAADLKAWGTALHTTVDWDRHGGVRPAVRIEVSGLEVQIWTCLDDDTP